MSWLLCFKFGIISFDPVTFYAKGFFHLQVFKVRLAIFEFSARKTSLKTNFSFIQVLKYLGFRYVEKF